MKSVVRIPAMAAAALILSSAARADHALAPQLRGQDASVSSAARLVSAYGLVTSTFRTIAHNKAVGGVANSYHLLDRAIDIVRRPGITHGQIEAALKKAGYKLIESLDERDHSHFAFAGPSPTAAIRPASRPSAPPPTPAAPQLAADQHGKLALDLQAPPVRIERRASR